MSTCWAVMRSISRFCSPFLKKKTSSGVKTKSNRNRNSWMMKWENGLKCRNSTRTKWATMRFSCRSSWKPKGTEGQPTRKKVSRWPRRTGRNGSTICSSLIWWNCQRPFMRRICSLMSLKDLWTFSLSLRSKIWRTLAKPKNTKNLSRKWNKRKFVLTKPSVGNLLNNKLSKKTSKLRFKSQKWL